MVIFPPKNSPMTTRFCIVRHGETAWNAEMRVQGQLDIPLNATGRWQAQKVADALTGVEFDAVVSSDLLRAWETAQLSIVSNGVLPAPTDKIQMNAGLRERHYGKFQGLKYVEAQAQFPEDFAAHQYRHLEFAYGNGESLSNFAARVNKVMSALAEQHAGNTVLVLTHGGVLDVIYRMATGLPLQAPRNFPIPNAAINWLEHANAQWSVVDWANCAHLERALDELAP
jgi:probable phosphoglycerate mutase